MATEIEEIVAEVERIDGQLEAACLKAGSAAEHEQWLAARQGFNRWAFTELGDLCDRLGAEWPQLPATVKKGDRVCDGS